MSLNVENIVAGYGDSQILQGISLQVGKGEVGAVLGPNGAGKTTLLKAIMGLLKIQSGRVFIDSHEITSLSPDKILRSGIAYVPQLRALVPTLTVNDNLLMGAYILNDREIIARRLRDVFQIFPPLSRRKNDPAGVLSGGERQMLTIGRALMLEPRILALDEPSTGLDPKFLGVVYQKLKELNEIGTTILLVEQNYKKALEIADYAYVLEAGRVKLQGTKSDLSSDQKIAEVYLGARRRTL